ncbi:helix-turn-helix domain-containing protein [Nonomuraea phyllanthi]|uniref:Helix-turn-helix domain-containing protein n=1 Tax=Nonomuraea phyllanthi TaxID=2219224 RepID=A0A5C4WAL5_9ACTN|nr:helix-turn-helix transcriptional regulator [Nonomuraea phyllanthi]KAB8192534.1 helix-turn-helix domain-containing protein [Nonomuraea phyllanthi]QFY08011.1 helix-turn-helix domain-containing protein [Nonomuraea phyllanthi]
MSVSALPIGERIRYWREKKHRKQAAVAGLCGITEEYLSQIERGLKIPSLPVLQALAAELGVPVSALLGEKRNELLAENAYVADSVVTALMGYGPAGSAQPVTLAELRERVESVWRIWQTSPKRFTEAASVLPALIVDTENAIRAHRLSSDSAARRDVLRTAADLYFMLRSYCRRAGRVELSLMVADRALRAAEDADDPIRLSAAQWNLGHVLLADGEYEGAKQVALRGIEGLRALPRDADTIAMAGALELVAVVADARRKRWGQARERLSSNATPRAQQVGEGNTMWTVFGPTNVELHAVSIEMEAGEAAEALRVADQIDTSHLPSIERRFTFLLEVARCYDLRREDPAVLVHLLDLEQMAPEDLARNPLARNMVTRLRRRVRATYRRQVDALAERLSSV